MGSVLTLKVIEECIKKELQKYDFIQGDEPYKFDWTDKYRRSMNLRWYNNKLSSKDRYISLKILKQTKLEETV